MPRIPEDKIDEIRTSVNIVHYIQQFVNLKKAGQNFKGLCPFHTEKTPSFVVSPDKQIFRCFGCGKGGNIYTFIKEYEKLSFSEALVKAADFAGISLPKYEENPEEAGYFQQLYQINETACSSFEQNLWLGKYKKYLQYFLDRSLSEETIKKFRLGFAPDSFDSLLNELKKANINLEEAEKLGLISKSEKSRGYYDKFRYRVIFPFHNISGKIVGFGGRQLLKEHQPKYLNSPESAIYEKGKLLYGLHQAIQHIREENFVILVEGYFDLLRLYESGFKNVVASSGTAFTENQARLLRRYCKQVHIAYDGDQAGIKAATRTAQIIEKEGLSASIVALPEGEDPDTFILKQGPKSFEALLKKDTSPLEFQINDFYKQNPNPDFEQKEQFIEEIINQLAELPNQVKTGLYLHQLSDVLQINESFLIDQLNRYKRYRSKQNQPAQEKEIKKSPSVNSGMYQAEAGLIGLLLNGSDETRNLILNEVSVQLFSNHNLKSLFEHILEELEDTGNLDSGKLLDQFNEDEEMVTLISELSINDYGQENRFVKDCIFQVNKFRLEQRNKELELLIKQEADSPEALEHHYHDLMENKKQLNQLIKTHRAL